MQDLDKISHVYILSFERSGSTLLSSMLNAHPNIITANEEPFAYFLYKKYKKYKNWDKTIVLRYVDDFYFFWENKFNEQFGTKDQLLNSLLAFPILNVEKAIKLTYLNFFPQKNKDNVTTIIDKQIRHHYILKDLQLQFPAAKFIVLVRDPRDTVAIKLNRARKAKTRQDVYSASVNWNYVFKTIIQDTKKVPKDKIHYVKYENLVINTEEELKKISEFLNIDYDSNTLNFNEGINSEYLKFTESSKQLFDKIHSSLKTKVNANKVGIWEKDLSETQAEIVTNICGEVAYKYGYETKTTNSIRFNKSYIRAMFFLNKKNIITKIYNLLIIYKAFSFLKPINKVSDLPG